MCQICYLENLFKVSEAIGTGRFNNFDEDAVREVEEHIKEGPIEFSPDDTEMAEICPKEDTHGLGYKPLQSTGVLSQKYGAIEAALKTNKRSKGIRGQVNSAKTFGGLLLVR